MSPNALKPFNSFFTDSIGYAHKKSKPQYQQLESLDSDFTSHAKLGSFGAWLESIAASISLCKEKNSTKSNPMAWAAGHSETVSKATAKWMESRYRLILTSS
jgi:hypothetical protein